MSLSIEVIARGVLISSRQVLLCENLKKGYFYLPGGHVEFGEPARIAVEREFLEETGLGVRAGALLHVSEGAFRTGRREHHEVNLLFHVELRTRAVGPVRVVSRERKIGFRWVKPTALKNLDIRPSTAREFLFTLNRPRPADTAFSSDFPRRRS